MIRLLFDGPPGHTNPGFIEAEDETGSSIKIGEWHQLDDKLWEIIVTEPLIKAEDRGYEKARVDFITTILRWSADKPRTTKAVTMEVLVEIARTNTTASMAKLARELVEALEEIGNIEETLRDYRPMDGGPTTSERVAWVCADLDRIREYEAELKQERDEARRLLTETCEVLDGGDTRPEELPGTLAQYLQTAILGHQKERRLTDEARDICRTLLACARSEDVIPQDLPDWLEQEDSVTP